MSHTKGPWKIFHGGLPGDDGFSIGSDNANAELVKVTAECWPCTIVSNKHREELQANAHLIAAAPDLLEACQELLSIINDSSGVAGYHLNGNVAEWDEFEVVEALEAAIGKATGSQEAKGC